MFQIPTVLQGKHYAPTLVGIQTDQRKRERERERERERIFTSP